MVSETGGTLSARLGHSLRSRPRAGADVVPRRFVPAPRSGSFLPVAVLTALLLGALLLNVGLGSVRVAPNQILVVAGTHLRETLADVPGGEEIGVGWRYVLDLPGIGAAAGWLDAQTAWLQRWARPEVSQREDAVVWAIRIPRTLLGAVIGAGLAVSGAAMQGVFRNPLADPGLIGVSSGAALGAVTAIVLDITLFGIWTLPVFAFLAGLAVTLTVYALARHDGKTEIVTLLLAGVAINAIAGATTGLLISVANDQELRSVTFWTLGSLGGTRWEHVGIVGVVTAVGVAITYPLRMPLNLFVLGEREARHLGVHVERVRLVLILTTAAMTGTAVAFAGAIGFVGLVVPHLVRLWLGPDHRRLIPMSALAGATLLLAADLVSRTLAAPTEFPIGVTMSIVGGPFFLWLILRTRREGGGWA